MRTRIIVKQPSRVSKVISLHFSAEEPSLYVSFPYIILDRGFYFRASKFKVVPTSDTTESAPHVRDNTYFFEKSPKLSYHLSGIGHIKSSDGKTVLRTPNAPRLDNPQSQEFVEIVVKNFKKFTEFDETKDKDSKEDVNLFLELDDNVNSLRLRGTRAVIDRSQVWFKEETPPNHPIVTQVTNITTGEVFQGFMFNFKPRNEQERIIFGLRILKADDVITDYDSLAYARSVYGPSEEDGMVRTELNITAPSDPNTMKYEE